MRSLSLTKGMPYSSIAARSYFAACARHTAALALLGITLCPVQIMASRSIWMGVADSSEVVTPVQPSEGSTDTGTAEAVRTDTIPFSNFYKFDNWQSPSQEAGTTSYQAWEIVCNRPTRLSFTYENSNYYNNFIVAINDSTIISQGSWNSNSATYYSILLPAGRHILKASYYCRYDNTYEEGEKPDYYGRISNLMIDDAQVSGNVYVEMLTAYPGLKQELQTALDKVEAQPEDEELYNALVITFNNVRKAVSYAPIIKSDLVVADSILNVGAYVDISEAVALGQAINADTSTSADYLAAFEALETSIAVQVSSNQSIDDWAFNTNNYYTIDSLPYYLDTTNKVAAFAGFRNSNVDVENLVIPSTIRYNNETYAVVSLYYNNYQQNNIRTITLPKTLRHIGDYALAYYKNISRLEIPANVERMGNNVFYYDNNLKSVKVNSEVPPTVGSLGLNSERKIKITIPCESFHAYRLVAGWNTDYNVLIGGEEGVTVSTGKLSAGDLGYVVVDEAGYLQEVNKLIVEGELNSDDWSKIKQMSNLTELDLSKALIDEIPNEAFYDRWAINKVTLPSTLKKIGTRTFYQTGLTSIDIPHGVTSIGEQAFGNNYSLEQATLPDSLTSMERYVFQNCYSLRSIKIPEKLTAIPFYTFQNCYSLQNAELHDSLTSIGDYSFENCALQEVNIPKSVNWIGSRAFNNNKNLHKLTLNEGLADIWNNAFAGAAIDTLICPSTLRNIHVYAFADCSKLSKVSLNEGLVNIDSYAFRDNQSLKEIVLPSSLEVCSGNPFSGCDSLVTIEARSVMPPNTDGSCPLSGNSLSKAVLYVPVWSLSEYQLASGWSSFYTFKTTDFMPQYVKVNKDFYFTLRDELESDYRPDIELLDTEYTTTDSNNQTDYQHGNLTISGRSKLAVNNFSMVLSPYAKYKYEIYNDYYYSYRTSILPTSLIVKGEMRAENVVLNLCNTNNRWQFVSFPFDVKVSDIVPTDSTTSWVIRSHSGAERAAGNTSNVWQNLTADDVLEAGKGYIMHSYRPNQDYSLFTVRPLTTTVNRQQIFNADSRTVALEENLAEFEHNRSWNLIGNPYPSYFDTRFLDFGAPFMVWNSYRENYEAYSPVDDSYILAPAEAFFVQRPVDEESITFLKDGRQTDRYARSLVEEEPASAPQRIKAALDNQQTATPRTVFNFTLSKDGNQVDRTRIVINEAATLSYEMSRDAAKFSANNAEVSQIFTLNGATRYAINERPLDNGQALLGLHFGADGNYTIALAGEPDGKVTLEDRLTGTSTALNSVTNYSFTAKAGDATDRFVLHFEAVATGINNAANADAEATESTYTLDGRKVNDATAPGVYIKGSKKVIKK